MHRLVPRFGIPLAAAAALIVGIGAAAEGPGPAAIGPRPPADAPQIEHFEYWRARGEAARAAAAETKARLDEANADVARMLRRNHPRGDARVALFEAQADAEAAHEAAMHHLEVELPAEARAAGASLRWLRAPS